MDLNAIKQRLNAMQQKPGKKNSGEDRKKFFWKPSVGKQVIRIVPSAFDKTNPFKELYFHYGIGNRTMISPMNFGDKDPIVEFAKQLRQSQDKENWKLAKKLDPKMRIFAPVIVRGEEHLGVRLWEFGKETYLELLSMVADEDIGDFSDIYEGRDLTIETVGPEVTGTKYNKSTVRPRTKITPLSDNSAQAKMWMSEQPEILTLYKKYEYDEMKGILLTWLNPEADVEESETEEVEQPVTPVVTSYTTPVKKKSSFNEDEFDALFTDAKAPSKFDDEDNDLPF